MSEVILDTITGKSTATTITIGSTPVVSASANSMTIRGEGSNQTSIQQGLAKMWIQFDGTGTIGTQDAFNRGGLTDNGTGNYTVTFTNNMNNNDYASSGIANQATVTSEAVSTSTINALSANHSGTLTDGSIVSVLVHGDLA